MSNLSFLLRSVIVLLCAVFVLGSLRGMVAGVIRDFFAAKKKYLESLSDEGGETPKAQNTSTFTRTRKTVN